MNGLDLRVRPPRAPYACLDGLVFLPRTIDKIRATFPGGDLGPYRISPGLSQTLMDLLEVDLEEFRRAVRLAQSDADVAVWLRTHADVKRYDEANRVLTRMRIADVAHGDRNEFESQYPDYLRARHPVLFDLLEADDAELYPALERE